MRQLIVRLVLGACCALASVPALAADGAELAGREAAEWNALDWIGSEPLRLADLRGWVVLIRWWTDTCPMCLRSAPALNALHDRYAKRGLVVIGMYHPKPVSRDISYEEIRQAVKERGFEFPIALDLDWSNLRRYWLNGGRRRATSVSFVLDKQGRIQHVHPGPEFHEEGVGRHAQCRADYLEIRQRIEQLLAEPFSGGEK